MITNENNQDWIFENQSDMSISTPKARIKVINYTKLKNMLSIICKLKRIIEYPNNTKKICIDIDPQFNLGSITVELDSLTVYNVAEFVDTLKDSDNFEVYPLINGNIRVDITFQKIFIIV